MICTCPLRALTPLHLASGTKRHWNLMLKIVVPTSIGLNHSEDFDPDSGDSMTALQLQNWIFKHIIFNKYIYIKVLCRYKDNLNKSTPAHWESWILLQYLYYLWSLGWRHLVMTLRHVLGLHRWVIYLGPKSSHMIHFEDTVSHSC